MTSADSTMRAMVFEAPGVPLTLCRRKVPVPAAGQILIKVRACAVCRTDLHLVDGDLDAPKEHVIPGHEIIGTVAAICDGVSEFSVGDRVGVPWLGWTCGACDFCRSGQENLCAAAQFTGYTLDGGFAEYTLADQRYCFAIPDHYSDIEAAPLMCAGLIGYRAFAKSGQGRKLGLYGFGAAAHILCQLATGLGRRVYAFTKEGDDRAQGFARSLGAVWAGSSREDPPEPLDAALIFAPVGSLVPAALEAVRPGGRVICAGIHMSDIPSFPYEIIWHERAVESVANLTRRDGIEFLERANEIRIRTATHQYPLEHANQALEDLRAGRFDGAAVLTMDAGAGASFDLR